MTETICIMAIADQSNREKEIFEQALDITPTEERLRFLTSACGKDAALLARVQALLRADESGESFLPEQPKATVVAITEKPGDRIGRYKLLQQIGEGGCGVVYMAEQTEPVRRRVALKVIKLGMDTKQVIARFEAERQALALMDHPNIAKVLDAGATETGRPYFVMELVRGIKITEFCDEKSVPTADRLKLFTQVPRYARPSSTRTRKASSIGISNLQTYSSPSTTACPSQRLLILESPRPRPGRSRTRRSSRPSSNSSARRRI